MASNYICWIMGRYIIEQLALGFSAVLIFYEMQLRGKPILDIITYTTRGNGIWHVYNETEGRGGYEFVSLYI